MEGVISVQLIEPNNILQELPQLKDWKHPSTIKTLQRIFRICERGISGELSTWKPLLIKLLTFITTENIKVQQTLLAGRIFCTILYQLFGRNKFESYMLYILQFDTNNLQILENDFQIENQEMVKLIIIQSCLSISIKGIFSYNILRDFFKIIKKHCITYNEHTFISYRLLKFWLEYVEEKGFWKDNDSDYETKELYSLIISNWDNCINDVAKCNATEIFPIYLKIMQSKYPFFLEDSLNIVLNQVSWRNATKYIILTEIYKAIKSGNNNSSILFENDHIKHVVENLSRSHLKHVVTKLYVTIWRDMPESSWLNFYQTIHPIVERWEQENNLSGLQLIWDSWFKPTLPKFNSTSCYEILWYYFFRDQMHVSQSFLAKLAIEKRGMKLTSLLERAVSQLRAEVKNGQISEEKIESILQSNIWISKQSTGAPLVLDDERECIRLNGFAVYCQGTEFKSETEYNYFLNNTSPTFDNKQEQKDDFHYESFKRFMYVNAKAASNTLRKGIFDNFEIFLIKVISKLNRDNVNNFFQFMSKFIFYCFEINSCYQRKIIGLGLLQRVLDYLHKPATSLIYKSWISENKDNFYNLLRLCLDSVQEIREKASEIFEKYFASIILAEDEYETLLKEAIKYCGSSKFYKVCGGAKILKIITAIRNEDNFSNYLLREAEKQLSAVKTDILKATANGSPFYGTMKALLEIYFSNTQIKTTEIQINYLNNLLVLLEEASSFFLSSLSPKSTDIEYSSSFAEMGVAIQEIIYSSEIIEDNAEEYILSPAHQTILSCIWMSLATICELAGELTYIESQTEEMYKRSINIVITILMKCRHKGVIETAGGVLARLMNNQNLNHDYFTGHLDKLLNLNYQDKIDLTRRGAGQTIMFHKLVANGNKKRRPLLIIALKTILEKLNMPMEITISPVDLSTNDNPVARQIHFLRTIVSDKSLYPTLIQYMEDISLACLHYSGSTEWPIKNASLQLFGAIIPRLVGSSIDSELDFSTGYSVEHFLTHYPRLAVKILQELKCENKMIPLLTLLSKMTIARCDYIDSFSSKSFLDHLASELYSLFNYPGIAVRNLVAKTYAAIIPHHKIAYTLFLMANANITNETPNFNNSYFLTQVYLHMRAKYECRSWHSEDAERLQQATDMQLKRFERRFLNWCQDRTQINYIVEVTCMKSLLLSVQLKHCHPFKINEAEHVSIIRKIKCEQSRPGFWEFIDYLTRIHWQFANFDECLDNYPEIFYNLNQYSICLMSSVDEHFKKIFLTGHDDQRLRQSRINFALHLLQIVNCTLETNDNIPLLLEFITKLLDCCRLTEMDNQRLEILQITKKLLARKMNYLWKSGIILATLNIFENDQNNQTLLNLISYTIPNEDGSEKKWALYCITNLLKNIKFNMISIQIRNTIIETLVTVLNNEVSDIRILCNKHIMDCVITQNQRTTNKNSELYLHDVLQIGITSCLSLTDSNHKVELDNFVKNILHTDIRHLKEEKGTITNPFSSHEGYREDAKICDILIYLIINHHKIHQTGQLNLDNIIEIGNNFQKQYITNLKNKNNLNTLSVMLNCNSDDYLLQKIRALYDTIREC